MRAAAGISLAVAAALIIGASAQEEKGTVSFKNDVFPIIKQNCLPCHAEESFNPSELSLDTYAALMEGGKHGLPVVAGKPSESIMVQKLSKKPPFGDPMPLAKKKPDGTVDQREIPAKDLAVIRAWIDQGAKDN